MKIIGLTGSKGKTSVCYLLYQYLNKIGKKVSIYSSLDYEVAIPSNERLIEIINKENEKHTEYLILEINEEYINMIDSSFFDIKVLTSVNVITDKEEFNKYLDNLLSFFKKEDKSQNVICYSPEIEKDAYLSFISKLNNKTLFGSFYEIEKYGLDKSLFYSLIYNDNKRIDNINGIRFYIKHGKDLNDSLFIESNLLFDYSAYNINCLFSIINTLELYNEELFISLVKDINIPGRCEVIKVKNRTIIITMSIIPTLESLYQYKQNNEINEVITVVGSIGTGHNTWSEEFNSKAQEEKLKHARRYAMNYASLYSDFIYLTSSDPASTSPLTIANEMERYLIDNNYYKTFIEIDRYKAIKLALLDSNAGDVIIISGRGNRKKYIKENKEYSFSDSDLVKQAIKELGW